jgi:hypothetical protein
LAPANIHEIVYILTPIIEATKQAGDLPNQPILPSHFLIVNCFVIPAKKNTGSSPVIVKLHSEAIQFVVFKYKKTVLPPCLEPSSNHIQNKYSIFEDLAPSIHTQLRALADNICVHSVWPLEAKCDFKHRRMSKSTEPSLLLTHSTRL